MQKIIVDTGFLVAFLSQSDNFSFWAQQASLKYKPPYFVCDQILSETAYLLHSRFGIDGLNKLFAFVSKGDLKVDFSLVDTDNLKSVAFLTNKYPAMGFFDACVVAMTEQKQFKDCLVLTTDFKDFSIYRRFNTLSIPCDTPFGLIST